MSVNAIGSGVDWQPLKGDIPVVLEELAVHG